MRVRMSTKGQLVIPKPMRLQLGLDAGTMVEIAIDEGRLVLQPIEARSPLDALVGLFADGPDLIAALEAEHRWEIERHERHRP